ncbi:MAG: cell envelope integrity EipB family protein [Acetobacteraceae bacterium]
MRLRPLALLLASLAAAPAWAADRVPMAAHRALYRLTMESSRGGDVSAATGSMAYEITDACDGWATRQRLAMTITNRDGQAIEMVSDYATWESKDGLNMRFRMRQTTDTAVTEQAEGSATLESAGGRGTIHYTVPEEKELPMPAGTVFPMAHTEAIIAAAMAGKRFVALPIFDGTGDKGTQDSSIAIINWGPTTGAPYPALADLPSGRVRIAFFDRTPRVPTSEKPTGSPDYEVGMKYFANGVADDLHMDFSDFVMQGRLSEFAETPSHC